MRHWLGFMAAAAVTLGAGCGGEVPAGPSMVTGGGGETGTATTPAPTFAQVYDEVLSKRGCATSYCHFLISGPTDLGPTHNAYVHLVGVVAKGDGCDAMTLVEPGDPEHSLLYLKVSMDKPPCGDRMPTVGPALEPAQVDLIRAWIEAGAPE